MVMSIDTAHALAPTVSSVASGNWSSPSTWSAGMVPSTNAIVDIAAGHTVTYDVVSSIDIGEVQVHGTLSFSRTANTQLDAGSLLVFTGGTLEIGTEASPIPSNVKVTIRLVDLTGVITYDHLHGQTMLQPVLHTHGGTVDIHGSPLTNTWTMLTQNAAAGASTLTVANSVSDWKVGDKIIITGTNKMRVKGQTSDDPMVQPIVTSAGCDVRTQDFNCLDSSTFQAEERTIASVSGNTITLSSPLTYLHKGSAHYEAAVGNLTRNIVITSKNPTGRRGPQSAARGVHVLGGNT